MIPLCSRGCYPSVTADFIAGKSAAGNPAGMGGDSTGGFTNILCPGTRDDTRDIAGIITIAFGNLPRLVPAVPGSLVAGLAIDWSISILHFTCILLFYEQQNGHLYSSGTKSSILMLMVFKKNIALTKEHL